MANVTGAAVDIAIICSDFEASLRFYRDLQAVYDDRKAKGVRFLSEPQESGATVCAVDPDGVIIELIRK